jgi:nitrite reductase/ring-hydroxylating ferredoxin subunit
MADAGAVDPRVAPYNAYYNRPQKREHLPLHQVGPGTPGGEYLRRFWHPVMLTIELGELPKAIKILGEDLVIFRDKSGHIGLLNKFCGHRGVSLEFGLIAEHGIRCCYHGWLYDVDGKVLETPAEPPNSPLKCEFNQGAYPVRENGPFIFAYMGPPETMPPLPEFESFYYPQGNELAPYRLEWPCNWLQIQENAADPVHTSYLHAIVSGQQFSPAFNELPALDFVDTPLGFLAVATRRVKDHVFIRSSDIILPNIAQVGPANESGSREKFIISGALTRWVVPIDDEHSFTIGCRHLNDIIDPERKHLASDMGIGKGGLIGQTDDRPYEERQIEPGDYDAITSQGAVANLRNEHLGTTDSGVTRLRRQVMLGIKAVQDGEDLKVPRRYGNALVPTYSHDIVVKLPSQANVASGNALRAFGRRAVEVVIETGALPAAEREVVARERIQKLAATDLVE